jgi:TonB family protein
MNRLQKKCLISSAGFHLLLVVILLVGPAFLSSKSKPDNLPVIDFIPSRLVDASVVGGGNPNARPPEPAPPSPALPAPPAPAVRPPPAAPERVQKAEPVKEPTKTARKGDAPEKSGATKSKLNTNLVTRTRPTTAKTGTATPDTDSQTRAEAKRIADQIGRAAAAIRRNSTPSTSLEPFGPGGGGETYAGYDAWVKAVYENAWIAPDDTQTDDAVVKVRITIASDGKVTDYRILQLSGDEKVDASVRRTLERVTFIKPFPEGAKEKERNYTINFNLKAKRLLG